MYYFKYLHLYYIKYFQKLSIYAKLFIFFGNWLHALKLRARKSVVIVR